MAMKFSILRMTKTELEVELDELDPTLTELIAEKLNSMKDVEMAAAKWEHPLVAKPKLFVRVKKGSPVDAMEEAISNIEKEVKAIQKVVDKAEESEL